MRLRIGAVSGLQWIVARLIDAPFEKLLAKPQYDSVTIFFSSIHLASSMWASAKEDLLM